MRNWNKSIIAIYLIARICIPYTAKSADLVQNSGSGAQATAVDPIKYYGIWLSGKNSEADKNFPVGKKFALGLGNESTLSAEILQSIRKSQHSGGGRLVDAVAPDDYMPEAASGKALVMASAINYEEVESVEIGGVTKVMAEIGFNLVICDFSKRSVVVCLPGRIMRTDVAEGRSVTPAQKNAMLEKLYRDELPKQFIKMAGEHGPEIMGLDAIGVTKVTVFDDAKKVLPEWMMDKYEDYFGNVVGSNFYEGVGLPLLPFSKGNEMVFCNMKEGVSDASKVAIAGSGDSSDGISFTLKKPAYEVELVIPAFKTITATSNEVGKLVQNCSYARITIKHGDETIYTSQHDGSAQNLVPKGSSEKVPWLAYSDAVNEMFFKGGKKIKSLLSGEKKHQDNPLMVVEPSALKNLFVACAPWTLIHK